MTPEGEHLTDDERVVELLGARDLIRECQEMLLGQREHLTTQDEYLKQRLAYWQSLYTKLDHRRAERRTLERRTLAAGRHSAGRRTNTDRRASD